MGRSRRMKMLLQSPFTLHSSMLGFIEGEIETARAGKRAYILAKMNALAEPQIVMALYRASQAGVKIDLVVRGICILRPGVRGVSDNIRVLSIVGRFLEHTRVFYFENAKPGLFLSSADWMGRNFFNRVESCFPINDERAAARILAELRLYLADNCQAWLEQSDGTYSRAQGGRGKRRSAQNELLRNLADVAPLG
jgi:polyphosphate kinase